jgi:hypothetical protein
MPILERDPWRMQYFEGVACPEDLIVPTEDGDAYALSPNHRWVYNKLLICETQGLVHGLHGMEPPAFPVFSKPIYNMRGMGAGSRVLRTPREYQVNQRPGHMWMPLLEGEHVSSDAAVVDGEARWWRHVTGAALSGGMFDHWTVHAEDRPELEGYCGEWLGRNLRGYTGMVNFETIGGRIIEIHLRFSDQWPDLYGDGWLDALVRLYAEGRWNFRDPDRRTGFSVVLFGAHGLQYAHPPRDLVQELLTRPGVTSIQITFHEDRPPQAHSMPPGGFRLAIVNCHELETGLDVRERLALAFGSTRQLVAKRSRWQTRTA